MPLRLQNVEFAISHFHLGPLNHEWADGSLHIIRGKNGSGKTSLLRLLMKRLTPLKGEISGVKTPIAPVGIDPVCMGSWTVRENIRWLENLSGLKSDPSQWDRLLPILEKPFYFLSEGLKRQVELTFFLSSAFPLLLLDEPLSPLDQEQKKYFKSRLIQKAHEGATILMTSHDEEDISELSSATGGSVLSL